MPDNVEIRVDIASDVAYVGLSRSVVVRTVEVTDDVLVDLDEFDVAVGVEVLRLAATLPTDTLTRDYHVHSEALEQFQRIRPSVHGFLRLSQSGEGSSTSSPVLTGTPVPA